MDNYLVHHGVLGQKWGVRRYQNSDGSLTSEGKSHYGSGNSSKSNSSIKAKGEPRRKQLTDEQKEKVKKAVKVGAVVAGTALVAYGAYKVGSNNLQFADAVARGKDALRLNYNIAAVKAVNRARTVSEKTSNGMKTLPSSVKKGAKTAGKKAVSLIKEGAKSGAEGAMKDLGKVATGGILWMAGIEVADLATNGAATQKILNAYNDHTKKDNRVKTSYRNKREDD